MMHAAEDDEAVPGRFDLVVEHLEAVTEPERGDLRFDQPLRRLRQRALRLADADRKRAAFGLAALDQKLAEEMRLARAPSSKDALVARRLKQRLKDPRRRNFQDRQ